MSTTSESNSQENKLEFLEYYKAFEQYKKDNQNSPTLFDVNAFNQGTININNREYNAKSQKYSKKDIRRYLERPEYYERQLREVSVYLYSTSQEYKNLINYLSKMLTHDYILIPDGNLYDILYNTNSSNTTKLLKSFYANLEFIENYNLKSKLSDVEAILLREDIYFGYERTDGENNIWQQLPSNYSRILGWDEYGGYTMEFDFTYFTKQNVSIDNYDQEFKDKYKLYNSNYKDYRWQKLSDKAIVFKFDKSVLYGLPQFSGIFVGVLGISDYQDLQEESSVANNYRLLHQQIPQNVDKEAKTNDFKIDDKSAAKFHANVVRNVAGNHIGVVTTPMKIEAINLSDSKIDEDLVGKAEKNLFTSAGVSQLLFNADKNGAVGLNRSIEADAALMFSLLRQEELFMKKKLKMFNTGKYKWKLIFPNLTVFNLEDYRKALLNNAQAGYSKFCTSMSQIDIMALLYLENDILKLPEKMIPTSSSFTQSGGVGGRPNIDQNKLSPGGLDQINKENNLNKPQ